MMDGDPRDLSNNVIALPARSEFDSQHDRREYVHLACEGQPPARRKKLILDARAAGLLADDDVQPFLDAHGVANA